MSYLLHAPYGAVFELDGATLVRVDGELVEAEEEPPGEYRQMVFSRQACIRTFYGKKFSGAGRCPGGEGKPPSGFDTVAYVDENGWGDGRGVLLHYRASTPALLETIIAKRPLPLRHVQKAQTTERVWISGIKFACSPTQPDQSNSIRCGAMRPATLCVYLLSCL